MYSDHQKSTYFFRIQGGKYAHVTYQATITKDPNYLPPKTTTESEEETESEEVPDDGDNTVEGGDKDNSEDKRILPFKPVDILPLTKLDLQCDKDTEAFVALKVFLSLISMH